MTDISRVIETWLAMGAPFDDADGITPTIAADIDERMQHGDAWTREHAALAAVDKSERTEAMREQLRDLGRRLGWHDAAAATRDDPVLAKLAEIGEQLRHAPNVYVIKPYEPRPHMTGRLMLTLAFDPRLFDEGGEDRNCPCTLEEMAWEISRVLGVQDGTLGGGNVEVIAAEAPTVNEVKP